MPRRREGASTPERQETAGTPGWISLLFFVAAVAALLLAGMGVFLFVIGVFVMILAHEAGHFVTARAFGIKVEEFFLGFGPRLWSVRRGETEYGIKAIPAGGYVRIAGMNPFQEPAPEDRPRTFGVKPAWQRAIVLVAGSATHFVLAFLALALFFGALGVPRARVARVEPTLGDAPSPAAQAGIQPGDEVLAVDGQEVTYDEFLVYTRSHVGEEIDVVVERDGRRITLSATPVLARVGRQQVGRLGIVLEPGGRLRAGPVEAVVQGVWFTGQMVVRSFEALGRTFSPDGLRRFADVLSGDRPRQVDDVTSVVGAARLSGQAVAAGQIDLLLLMFAGFNVFVGILNLLPLPPLDGGHLAVVAIEKVIRRKVDVRRLVPISAAVAGFLILLMLTTLYLDVVRPLPNPFQ
ncbi:MAG TPA: site-2 protease family protein [Actinomycetota bacterium]|jgi:membrane-associated protease RseP (regulator of RpoE activity)|nr:site-2 protease family protein [Actinomycetota bacterium]